MIAFIRGYIAGIQGQSAWMCPYWINIEDDDSVAPTDPRALKWNSGWDRASKKPPIIMHESFDNDEPDWNEVNELLRKDD